MEIKEYIGTFINEQGLIVQWPAKQKKQIACLFYIFPVFEANRFYTEQEINILIDSKCAFHDPALIRRDLFNLGFLCRKIDGSSYWVSSNPPTKSSYGLD